MNSMQAVSTLELKKKVINFENSVSLNVDKLVLLLLILKVILQRTKPGGERSNRET